MKSLNSVSILMFHTTWQRHVFSGYDNQFLIRWLIEQKRPPTRLITRGLQIMTMECMGVRLIDSMSFVAQALESFPKTFGETELKKGHFPYLFYKEENLQYVGAFPDADQYCPSRKPAKKRTDFYNWYKLTKSGIFDMDKEADEYCESDVAILMRCMRKFDDMYYDITGIRPLSHSISIAQACNYTWRKNFMEAKSVAIIPPDGYNSGDRISKESPAMAKVVLL